MSELESLKMENITMKAAELRRLMDGLTHQRSEVMHSIAKRAKVDDISKYRFDLDVRKALRIAEPISETQHQINENQQQEKNHG